MLTEAFATVLRNDRVEFNRRFTEAKRLYPALDGEAFSQFLMGTVDPIIKEIARVRPDRVCEGIQCAYDVGLELAGQKLIGAGARYDSIEEGWRRVLVPAAGIVSLAPAQVLAAVTNALHQLATTSGARPQQWIDEMEQLAPACEDANTLLQLGQVCAWRAGLAHFREGALALTDTLPEKMMLTLFNVTDQSWASVKEKLLQNPWFNPADPQPENTLRVVSEAGSFRGFGGLFVEPPIVSCANNFFFVRSGKNCWLLTADLFGATFHRADPEDFDAGASSFNARQMLTVQKGKVTYHDQAFEFPMLGEFTSFASNTATLAITAPYTHGIVLISLT